MTSGLRAAWGSVLLAGILAVSIVPAEAQFLPRSMFDNVPTPGGPAKIEADQLSYDSRADVITASGNVVMRYSDYSLECDSLRYVQKTGELLCQGNARLHDPDGGVLTADRLQVTGGMKQAFIESLSLTTNTGAIVTASSVGYSSELERVLTDATYSPCGLCIDSKGRKIGWKVKTARIIQDPVTKQVTLENPTLEVLGVPIAWLPWLSLPDPTNPRPTGFRLPGGDYSSKRGAVVSAPYFIALGEDTDILLTPQLMSRQGFLMAAEWEQRFDYGKFNVTASGLYQLDPSAFAGTVGDREWRGALQTSGHFELGSGWSTGWSYTAFTDAAYLDDYGFKENDEDILANEVYVTQLSPDLYADIRVQEFMKLGDFTAADQRMQALAVPNARFDGYYNDPELGQFEYSGSLLGVQREADDLDTIGSTNYVFGYEGRKLHGTVQASWQKPIITTVGVVATPFLGVRADAASFEGDGSPADQSLFALTPIAAIDVRFPMMASDDEGNSSIIEPIAQMVYRATDTSLPGIVNDNAHSFVLDETNLFSYNRFSGTDRQETGLRANVGVRYQADLADGRWLELVGGQSFHLAGVNGLGIADEVNTGVSTGLGDDASYIVLGARGSPSDGTTLGAKLQIDPNAARVARAGFGGDMAFGSGLTLGGDFLYLPPDSALGVADAQEELTVRATAPLPADYWTASGSLSWDMAAGSWLEATGELLYDDGYFLAGAYAKATGPTHQNPDDVSFGLKFKLKAPDGQDAF
jgi:LPS-assembly protein